MDMVTITQILGNLGEFIGAIAVLVTLVYLAIQVKHSRDATERNSEIILAQNYQSRSEAAQRGQLLVADSQYLAPLMTGREPILSDVDDLNDEEALRLSCYFRYLLFALDNQHYQYERGFIDREHFETVVIPAIRNISPTLKALGLLEEMVRPSFRAAVEQYQADEGTGAKNDNS